MSKILVINIGSSSVKYGLFENGKNVKESTFNEVEDHEKIIRQLLRELGDISEIDAIGHRVVHGGKKYTKPLLVDADNLADLKLLNDLAPLHNPYNIMGIEILSGFLPETPQVAVFDTAFFSELDEVVSKSPLPDDLSAKFDFKKYGFHGISHSYLSEAAAEKIGKAPSALNLITCHLGGGWSVAAIKKGRPVDTSMGFTPLAGLMMMTRPGDIDPGIIFELVRELDFDSQKIDNLYEDFNHNSGIKAISGGVDDYRELLKEMNLGKQKAKLAFDMAVYRLAKYIASYFVPLGGEVDAIVFSGSIGSGDPVTRHEVMKKIRPISSVKSLAIETDEELMIARQTEKIIND